jgi:heme exporter protein D
MMEKLLTFLDMGGYALWVWPAYGISAAALIGLVVFARRNLKAREREFETLRAARRGEGTG